MIRILFVCTGNTCRSPMAEAILKNKAIDGIEVKSAGVYAVSGSEASPNAKLVLQENNIPENHRSTVLSEAEINWATHIFTMTEGHKRAIVSYHPRAIEKTFTLKEFAEDSVDKDVVDPYGGPVQIYRDTFSELHQMIEKMLERLDGEVD
jgi:protein arginine phosphatase